MKDILIGYNKMNYDAIVDTNTNEDFFVLERNCYHISLNKRILEYDPVEALVAQPVVFILISLRI